MIRSLIILFAGITASTVVNAQSMRQGEWRTYTAMTAINDIAAADGYLWAATDGGVFRTLVADPKQENMLALRTSDGLGSNEVSAVAVSGDDVYLAMTNGILDQYSSNNRSIRSYRDIYQSTLIRDKRIYALTRTGDKLLISAAYGLSFFDTRTSTFAETVTRFASLPGQDTVFTAFEHQGRYYAVLSGGIASADVTSANLASPFEWTFIAAPDKALLRSAVVFGGQIVASGLGGLYKVDLSAQELKEIVLPDSIQGKRMLAVNNTLWILDQRNNGRLIRTTDLTSFEYTDVVRSAGQTTIRTFTIGGNNERIFGYSAAGITVAGSATKTDIFPSGPISNSISDLYFSANTQKLFGSFESDGISQFDPHTDTWNNFGTVNNTPLQRTQFRRVFYDSTRSVLYASSHGGGIYKLRLNGASITSERLGRDNGLSIADRNGNDFVVVGQMTLDRKGNLLATVWGINGEGLCVSSDGTNFKGVQLNTPSELYRPYSVVTQDLDGYYFVGTINNSTPQPYGVLYVAPDNSTGSLAGGTGNILTSPAVNALIVDQDNGLWCGHNSGVDIVSHFRNGRTGIVEFRARKVPFLDQQIVKAIAVDGVGNKWVGTENGVFVVTADGADSVAHYTSSNSPLLDNNIIAIAIDNASGEVYIASQRGISRTSSIFKTGSVDYANMIVYPNPVIYDRYDDNTVTITGLVSGSTVKIYSVSGRLIKTIDGTLYGATVTWDGRDDNGKELASGVYIASATSPLAEETGQTKFVVVRKK
jgi:hypothetical protein